MTRGNQRDLARLKNAKKQEALKKSQGSSDKNPGASLDNRMARDADIMRQKQQKAAEKKGEDGSTTKKA